MGNQTARHFHLLGVRRREEEYAGLVRRRRTPMLRAALMLGCTLADAEDAVQATLLQAYVHWSKLQRADNPDAYLYRMLLNSVRADARRAARRKERSAARPIEDTEGGSDFGEEIQMSDALTRVLKQLSREHCEVLLLRFYLDMSVDDCAVALGIAPGTVKSRSSRAVAEFSRLVPDIHSLEGHER